MNIFANIILSVLVVTSTYELAQIVKNVSDPSVEIIYLVDERNDDVYVYRPNERDILNLTRADIFVHSGTFEKAWLNTALSLARNPKIIEGGKGNIDLSRQITAFRESHCYVILPENYIRIANIIAGNLKDLGRYDEKFYQQRISEIESSLSNSMGRILNTTSPLRKYKISGYYPCSFYMGKMLGLEEISSFFLTADNEKPTVPNVTRSARHFIKEGIKWALLPQNIDPEIEMTIALAGMKILKIPHHLSTAVPDFSAFESAISQAVLEIFASPVEKPEGVGTEKKIETLIREEPVKVGESAAETEIYGVVTKKQSFIVVYSNSSVKSSQVGKIKGGTKVKIIDLAPGWYRVTDGQTEGWVSSKLVIKE